MTAVYKAYSMADVRSACAQPRFTVLSTCAGRGGSSLGYALAGGRVLLANEIDQAAVRTYKANFPTTLVDTRDLRLIATTSDSIRALLSAVNLNPGELDILDGSPPCEELSKLGRGIKQRGSATLIFDFFKLARGVLPKIIIAENVPPLVSTYRDLFENALGELRFDNIDGRRLYYANWRILSAAHYGTPQARRRVIVIGVRRDVAEALGIYDDAGIMALFPAPLGNPITVRAALADVNHNERDVEPWLRSMRTSAMGLVVAKFPRNPAKLIYARDVGLSKTKWYSLIRSAYDLPSPTLTSTGQLLAGIGGVIHPTENRKFSVPELKSLFALAKDFYFPGSINDAVEGMGKMVAPLLMKALAESVYERVLRPYAELRR